MGPVVMGLAGLAILVVIFLVFRAGVLWYWKLDKIEEHLDAIRRSLDKSK